MRHATRGSYLQRGAHTCKVKWFSGPCAAARYQDARSCFGKLICKHEIFGIPNVATRSLVASRQGVRLRFPAGQVNIWSVSDQHTPRGGEVVFTTLQYLGQEQSFWSHVQPLQAGDSIVSSVHCCFTVSFSAIITPSRTVVQPFPFWLQKVFS